MKDHRITVRFSPEMRRRLKSAARRGGTRESDLVRGAVELQLAAEEASLTAYEHAKKSGLIGAVKGGNAAPQPKPRVFGGLACVWTGGVWVVTDPVKILGVRAEAPNCPLHGPNQ